VAFNARLKAKPKTPVQTTHFPVRHDRIDSCGRVTLRYLSRLRHIAVGRAHAHQRRYGWSGGKLPAPRGERRQCLATDLAQVHPHGFQNGGRMKCLLPELNSSRTGRESLGYGPA
jgi:hypothetical protein